MHDLIYILVDVWYEVKCIVQFIYINKMTEQINILKSMHVALNFKQCVRLTYDNITCVDQCSNTNQRGT